MLYVRVWHGHGFSVRIGRFQIFKFRKSIDLEFEGLLLKLKELWKAEWDDGECCGSFEEEGGRDFEAAADTVSSELKFSPLCWTDRK